MVAAGSECPGKSYVAAGFVKWIEAAGGRAVPIRFYASDDELHRIFKSINGIIFPVGHRPETAWAAALVLRVRIVCRATAHVPTCMLDLLVPRAV
jgi:hypothetical protein